MITCLSPIFQKFRYGKSGLKDKRKIYILDDADKSFFYQIIHSSNAPSNAIYLLLSCQAFDKPVASGQ
jgi:hypothetical protein